MNFEKKQVALSAIRPSGTNPRDDMGDIDALADAIRATGNEPVNPPVVVADGNVYRIVDGERRYRALKQIWKSNTDHEVTVLVADGMDDAAELVAMLATDDKKPLTDVERGHGVQQMLILGVDEERVARATRATREQLAAARAAAPIVPAGAQVTLDQMVAAMAFEAEEDREAVLSAGDGWYSKVSAIRRRDRERKRMADIDRLLEQFGIPVASRDEVEGMDESCYIYDSDGMTEVKRKLQELPVQDGSARAVKEGIGGLRVYVPEGTVQVDAEERARDREESARTDLALRMVRWVMSGAPIEVTPELHESVVAHRQPAYGWGMQHADSGLEELFRPWSQSLTVSLYEAAQRLMRIADSVSRHNVSKWTGPDNVAEYSSELLDAVEIFQLCGFELDDGDEWLIERAQSLLDAELNGLGDE